MPKYRVVCNKVGFAIVEADNAEEAVDKAEMLPDHNFDWSDSGDHEVVEKLED